jgi:hypothetical protein
MDAVRMENPPTNPHDSPLRPKMRDGKPVKAIRLSLPLPVCPVHAVEMYVGSSSRSIRYCYCPVDGCRESKSQNKPLPRAIDR